MTYSESIASFINQLKYDNIPVEIVNRAKQLMLDTRGVAIAGTQHANSITAREAIFSIPSSQGDLDVWGSTEGLSLPYAVLANGITAHVLDFDDTHTESIVHGSAILTPLVLGLGAELNASGEEVLEAFMCGWEIAARVGQASKQTFVKRGYHTTCVAGTYGATAAAAKLLKLTTEQTVNAIGLCGSQAGGVSEFLTNSSSSKAFHAGWAGHSAVIACYFAKSGMTAPSTIFEGKYGVFSTHGIIEEAQPELVVSELGERWETGKVSIKPYPCCHYAHASIDCAKELVVDGYSPSEIENIHCYIDPTAAIYICDPIESKFKPKNSYGAKFSLPFLISAAIFDGDINASTFTAENIQREDLTSFATLVSFGYSDKSTSGFPVYFPGSIVATMKNGTVIKKEIRINRGNPDNPLTDEEIISKFNKNVDGLVSDEDREKIITTMLNLEKLF